MTRIPSSSLYPVYVVGDGNHVVDIVSSIIVPQDINRVTIFFSNVGASPIVIRGAPSVTVDKGVYLSPAGGYREYSTQLHGPIPGFVWSAIAIGGPGSLYVAQIIWSPDSD